ARVGHVGSRLIRVAGALAPMVCNGVRRDPEQPGRHRHSPPFKSGDRRERLLEHVGRDVLSSGPISGSAADERIDPVDVPFVNLDKSSGIGLRRFDQKPVVLGGWGQSGPRVSILITAGGGEGYGPRVQIYWN